VSTVPPDPRALSRGEWRSEVLRAVSVEVGGGDLAATEARRQVLGELAEVLDPTERLDVELLVSELVTNCVRHAGMRAAQDRIAVRAAVAADRLRLEVCDSGPGFDQGVPAPRDLDQGGGGLGLVLLDRLALAWGVAVDGDVCVWAEFERGGEEAAA
jgi:anti-sigma regulatory factor (Ser/Thr protein kinase)